MNSHDGGTGTARFGPVRLVPGVRGINALAYLYGAFAGITLTTFVSVIMPYVLNVSLGLPTEDQGRVAGDLVFYGEIVLLTMSGVFGAMSDRLGRRAVFVGGLLWLALGYVAFGYVGSLAMLVAVRVFMAVGITAVGVMVATVQVDYPAEESRGKLVGFAGMAIGLGSVLIGVLFARLPDIYTGTGRTELEAGQLTMLTMAGYCVLTALLLWPGLVGGRPPAVSGKPSLKSLLIEGMDAARRNPRILLAYGCAFVGRADLVVVGTFYSLWLTQAGIASGLAVDDAARTAGAFFAIVMTAALVWAPIMGWLNDRLDRTVAMALALALAAVGYMSMGLIDDPLGSWMYPAGVLLGIGQMSVTSASQTLIGQESPPEARGAVVGAFSLCGAAGILFVTSIGGRLYDAIAPAAPFVLIGAANGLLCLVAWWISRRRPAVP
ncbi:MAG: MFS transporter [Gammaproteobacteria bacterium]|nr:MFS transporter [Gammaproteobacteria bacterium]